MPERDSAREAPASMKYSTPSHPRFSAGATPMPSYPPAALLASASKPSVPAPSARGTSKPSAPAPSARGAASLLEYTAPSESTAAGRIWSYMPSDPLKSR